jgi:hypothetical protein
MLKQAIIDELNNIHNHRKRQSTINKVNIMENKILLTNRLIFTQKTGKEIIKQLEKIWSKYKKNYRFDLNNSYFFKGTDKKQIYTYLIKFNKEKVSGFEIINN